MAGASFMALIAVTGATPNADAVTFNGSNQNLTRTPGAAGNQKIAAISVWVKRAVTGTAQTIFAWGGGGTNISQTELQFNSSNKIVVQFGSTAFLVSTPTYTSTSQWYHIVMHADTNNATASLRCRVWVDGTEITTWDTDNRSSIVTGTNYAFNSAVAHYVGRAGDSATRFFNGSMSLCYVFDGVTLSGLLPSAFASAGTAIQYSGSYGTQGSFLSWANSASLGTDSSGNGNTWTLTNITSGNFVSGGGPPKNY